MSKSLMYTNTDDIITILRVDLNDIIRECMIEDTTNHEIKERYEDLVRCMMEYRDYGPDVRILKPESKMRVGRFYNIYYGIMIVPDNRRNILRWVADPSFGKKFIIYVPTYMLNNIIRRIFGHPKVIALSTTNDVIDSLSYCMRNTNINFSSKHPEIEKYSYCENDVKIIQEILSKPKEELMIQPRLRIKNVIFNDPATIVFWWDGTKTVVKAQEGDKFDPEKGLAMAVCKKVLGYNDSQSNFNNIFKHWLPKEEKKEPKVIGEIKNMTMTDKGFVVEAKITDAEFSPRINEILGILGE